MDIGILEVEKKYDPLNTNEAEYGGIEAEAKLELEVDKKYEPSSIGEIDYGDLEVQKKYELEVDKKTEPSSRGEKDSGDLVMDKKLEWEGIEEIKTKIYQELETDKQQEDERIDVEKKFEPDATKKGDENDILNMVETEEEHMNSPRTLVCENGNGDRKGRKHALFRNLNLSSPGSSLIDRLTSPKSRKKRALAKIKTITLGTHGRSDPPLLEDRDTTVRNTTDKMIADDNSSDDNRTLEASDRVGSLRNLGNQRHLGMAGLHGRTRSGLTRPGPKSKSSLAGPPPPRPTLQRHTLTRPSMAKSVRIKTSRPMSRRNLRRIKSFKQQKAPQKIQNHQEYLKLQQMKSFRRFDNSWNVDEPEEDFIKLPSVSILQRRPSWERSSEFNISARASARPSDSRRIASTQGVTDLAESADWFEFMEHVHDESEHSEELRNFETDLDHQDTRKPFYSRPCQRQRWGAKQVLPHVNWGDLFFDLFFVGMAANLGNLVIGVLEEPQNIVRGIIYFVGCFGPLFNSWEHKAKYLARYTVKDHCHQVFDIARIFVVGFGVVHINSLHLFADPKLLQMGAFTFSLVLDSTLSFLINMELLFFAKGDRKAIQIQTRRKMIQNAFFESAYIIACTLAGVFYWSDMADIVEENETDLWRLADLPLTLCCASYLLRILTQIGIMQYHSRRKKAIDFQNRFVPHNIEFLIQRYGEWFILMIGENVLALLIVDTIESRLYYSVLVLGVVTVTTLHFLKNESDPRKPSRHALLRGTSNGLLYSVCVQLVSMTLIAFGVSLRMFLVAIFEEEKSNETSTGITDFRTALLFCTTLTIALFSMELIHRSHSSPKDGRSEFAFCKHDRLSVSVLFALSAICKTLSLPFIALLPWWNTNPLFLSISGCMVTAFFAISRVITTSYQLATERKDSDSTRIKPPGKDNLSISGHPDQPSDRRDETIVSA